MDTLFMNSRISKTSDSQRLLLNLTYKINIKRSDEFVALQGIIYMEKCKIHTKNKKNEI